MNHHELNVIDFHTHFPVANVAGPKRKATHPLLAEYARSRGERMRKEHATLPAEPSAKSDESVLNSQNSSPILPSLFLMNL